MPDGKFPDLQSIWQALAVSEHLSIRRAAAALGLRSSAVSRRIRSLEEQLGVTLFERQRSGVQPTLAGRRFLDRARWVLAELQYAAQGATSIRKGELGSLGVAFYPSLVSGLLHDILVDCQASFPRVEFTFLEGASLDQLVALRHHRADVAFLMAVDAVPDAESEHLWDERVWAVLRDDHPLAARESLTWGELRDEEFVVRAYGSGPVVYAWLAGKLHPDGYPPNIRQHDIGRENLLGLVSAGYGVTVVSQSATGQTVPGLVFRPIAGDDAVLSVRMAWLKDNENPALGRFLSHARRVARQAQRDR